MDKYKKAIVEHEICRTEIIKLMNLIDASYDNDEDFNALIIDLKEMKQRFGIAKKRIGQLARNLVFIN